MRPNKKTQQRWATDLCDTLNAQGIKATSKWVWDIPGRGSFVVTYRITDRTWDYWKVNPDTFGGKTNKKIQRLWLVQSTVAFPNYLGKMCPEQRWQCEETGHIIEGIPLEYATSRANKF